MKAQDLIAKAISFNGYPEKESNQDLTDPSANPGDENYTLFNELYGELMGVKAQGWYWCAIYVSIMFYLACGKNLAIAKKALCGNLFASCAAGVAQFKKAKRFFLTPEPGDVIFFVDKNGRVS